MLAAGSLPGPSRLPFARLDPPIPPGPGALLGLLERWAAGERCPVELKLDLYELCCDLETGEVAYVYAGEREWPLSRWREVVRDAEDEVDPRWGL